jgi:hypothetical protein
MERWQAEGEKFWGIRDWASKHAGRVARIAALFHLLDHRNWPDPFAVPIAPETVAAAWAVGEWLCDHALAAFSRMGIDPRVAMAKRILGWIRRDRPRALHAPGPPPALSPGRSPYGPTPSARGARGARVCPAFARMRDRGGAAASRRRPSTSTLELMHTMHTIRVSPVQKPILCIV